jgi:hypothetical protein
MTARTFHAAALLAALACLAGCTSHRDTGHFMKSVNSIRPGTPMSVVREELGKPDETHAGTMPAVPPPGGLESAVGRIPPGARYQDWVYKHGDSRFHVLFGQTIVQSGERWEVVHVKSVPKTQPE